jgi:phage tail sheath gpL-like
MSLTNLLLDTDLSSDQLKSLVRFADKREGATDLAAYIQSLAAGVRAATMTCKVGAIQASGTFTLDTVIATDACSINGVSFDCVASGATGNQFNLGADDEETAANLAAAINASQTALVLGVVEATAEAEVVTVKAKQPGLVGNAIAIATADATITVSGARLTGGTDGTEYTLNFE